MFIEEGLLITGNPPVYGLNAMRWVIVGLVLVAFLGFAAALAYYSR
jgi:hypothetical protein